MACRSRISNLESARRRPQRGLLTTWHTTWLRRPTPTQPPHLVRPINKGITNTKAAFATPQMHLKCKNGLKMVRPQVVQSRACVSLQAAPGHLDRGHPARLSRAMDTLLFPPPKAQEHLDQGHPDRSWRAKGTHSCLQRVLRLQPKLPPRIR